MKKYSIGVDVGTNSLRIGLVDVSNGHIIYNEMSDIKVFNPFPDHYEQSSNDIWETFCFTMKRLIKNSKINIKDIIGIGFDSTCSLVVVDKNNEPVSISKTKNKEQNIILWMDHRAIEQANFINNLETEVLKYVGGKISPEMEIPK
jgi:D-ribulokinase